MALRIRTFGDPVLRERSRTLAEVDGEVRSLVKGMEETLAESPGRVGLAAPQVGVLKRLFVYDLGYGPHCLLNPEIRGAEGEELNDEGCLSFPGVYVAVPRFRTVRVGCRLPSGHEVEIEAEEFPARVMQHECDHLDGVLIIDRCDAENRRRALEEYQEREMRGALAED